MIFHRSPWTIRQAPTTIQDEDLWPQELQQQQNQNDEQQQKPETKMGGRAKLTNDVFYCMLLLGRCAWLL